MLFIDGLKVASLSSFSLTSFSLYAILSKCFCLLIDASLYSCSKVGRAHGYLLVMIDKVPSDSLGLKSIPSSFNFSFCYDKLLVLSSLALTY